MSDFLKDPLIQFYVITAIAIVAIVVTFVVFLLQKKYKNLSYEVLSQASVLSVAEEVSGNIKILFKGKAVKKVHLLIVRLMNTGNLPVTAQDFDEVISISFGSSSKILSAEISDSNPEKLRGSLTWQVDKAVLTPLLLNPKDFLIMKFLVSGYSEEINVEGRIVGGKVVAEKTDRISWWRVLSLIMGALFVGYGISQMPSVPQEQILTSQENIATNVFLPIGMLFILISVPRLFKLYLELILFPFKIFGGVSKYVEKILQRFDS